MVTDIINLVEQEFGTTEYPYDGKTFIMPEGKFLDLREIEYHADVEQFLIDNDLSDYYYVQKAGSPTLFELGCIRCSTTTWYLDLCQKLPTEKQYKSIKRWFELCDDLGLTKVEIRSPEGARARWYIGEMTPSQMVEKINEYYIFHKLYGCGSRR